ncbi:class I adenylate-forming enzyme family protein [Paracoccus sp. MKU1]|uniref:class I adenylate-forming enzyme family protein n=1 Tax=Paracoccus sp. MKU1 TaxID=1745182 RepID=UPI000A9BD809|nr:AMP-binding protein [Paracoccus sp. MKU1]
MRRIHELLLKGDPSHVAISDHDGSDYSYADLSRLVEDMAARLSAYGVRAGDRVMLLSENCVTYLVATLALGRLDAWTLLANARLTAAEVDRLAKVADIRCTIYTPEVSAAARAHAERMRGVSLGNMACGELLVSPLRDATPEPVEDGPEQTAVLIYTSGTVGEPKGVMLTHGNLLFMAQTSSTLRSISAADVTLAVLPGTHIFGLTSVFLAALAKGSRLIAMPRFDPDAVLDRIREDVTILPAVPQVFAALLRRLAELGVERLEHKNLRYIYAGGAPLDLGVKQRVERVFGLPLHNGYGQTEASPGIATTRLNSPRSDASVGLAVPGTEIRIHDPDEHGVGELWVRGPNVMKGYYRNPEATRAALTEDGFLRTGDLARRDPDGAIHIVGRLKELIVHSGFNVYPPEVEAVLSLHPAVSLSAVVGLARDGDEDVIAFVTTQAEVTEAELRNWLRERLAPYKVPMRIVIADTVPQAATGKILKSKLLEHFRDRLEQKE